MLSKLQCQGHPFGEESFGQNHTGQFSLYQTRLDTLVSINHPLPILATQIDWSAIVRRTPWEKVV